MELFELLWWRAGLAAAVMAVVGSVAARHFAPLLLGIVGLAIGGLAGWLLWGWFAEPGSWGWLESFPWMMGSAPVGALLGAVAGTVWALRRRSRRAAS
jgi:hypothetical protein